MNAEFAYFVDHLPSIIGAVFAGIVVLRQTGTKTAIAKIGVTTRETHGDIRNGAGIAISEQAMEHMKPALEKAATEAADKIEQKAVEVAAQLATWDGVERRKGPVDRRQNKESE